MPAGQISRRRFQKKKKRELCTTKSDRLGVKRGLRISSCCFFASNNYENPYFPFIYPTTGLGTMPAGYISRKRFRKKKTGALYDQIWPTGWQKNMVAIRSILALRATFNSFWTHSAALVLQVASILEPLGAWGVSGISSGVPGACNDAIVAPFGFPLDPIWLHLASFGLNFGSTLDPVGYHFAPGHGGIACFFKEIHLFLCWCNFHFGTAFW